MKTAIKTIQTGLLALVAITGGVLALSPAVLKADVTSLVRTGVTGNTIANRTTMPDRYIKP